MAALRTKHTRERAHQAKCLMGIIHRSMHKAASKRSLPHQQPHKVSAESYMHTIQHAADQAAGRTERSPRVCNEQTKTEHPKRQDLARPVQKAQPAMQWGAKWSSFSTPYLHEKSQQKQIGVHGEAFNAEVVTLSVLDARLMR